MAVARSGGQFETTQPSSDWLSVTLLCAQECGGIQTCADLSFHWSTPVTIRLARMNPMSSRLPAATPVPVGENTRDLFQYLSLQYRMPQA